MPRPRFTKLPKAKQGAILAVAAEEFAAHGLQAASFNRIIENAGLSKGAMYYYFDDKEDLFLAVLDDVMAQVVTQLGEFPSPRSAEEFWAALRGMYFRMLDIYRQAPQQASLARSFLRALGSPRIAGAYAQIEQSAGSWFSIILAQGQSVSAVRTDTPVDLLLAAAFGLLEGTDRWLIDRWEHLDDGSLRAAAEAIFGMLQRILRA